MLPQRSAADKEGDQRIRAHLAAPVPVNSGIKGCTWRQYIGRIKVFTRIKDT